MDADPTVKAGQKTVAVKILSPVQPVVPAALPGLPFVPVEFDGMTATAYVAQNTGRLAWSIRATAMRASPHRWRLRSRLRPVRTWRRE